MIYRNVFQVVGLGCAMWVLGLGCASQKTVYVDPSGPRTVATLGEINIQDFAQAAEDMTQSLLSSGVLDRSLRQPSVMAVSRIVNNTTQQIDTDLLTKKIRVALNKSGRVLTTTTWGPGGQPEDELAQELQREREYRDNRETLLPDYSLSGKIIETDTRAGKLRQSAFTFQLSLTDQRGLALWEEETAIVKQGKRSTVGW